MASSRPDFHRHVDGHVLMIAFDSPRSRNALNRVTRIELVEALQQADAAPEIRAIILTGRDPAFSSGVDAKELLTSDGYTPPPVDPPTALRGMATPVIAAVNGACVSGALEIALTCSFVIASDRAVFADTHARLGLSPGWGLSAELPVAIGTQRARQLALTGLPIDADRALAWGLVNEVVPHAALLDRARELAAAIVAVPSRSIQNALKLHARAHHQQIAEALRLERETLEGWAVDRGEARELFGDV